MDRKKLIDTFIKYNTQINLSAIRDSEGIHTKHIMDSIEINKVLSFQEKRTLCDVGTGGGFPLLPIAMTNPQITCTGIDSTRKKIDAINQMIKELNIDNAQALRSRAEEHKETYDYVTSRAVGYSDKLFQWIYHLAKKGGFFILYKQYTSQEERDIKALCKKKHLRFIKKHTYKLFPEDIQRVIYILQKE